MEKLGHRRRNGVGLILSVAASAMLGGIFAPTRKQREDAEDRAVRDHFGKRNLRRRSDISDPYFGIKSKGRKGAVERAALMKQAAPVRLPLNLSNPFKHKERREAFATALAAGALRVDAMKFARRVKVEKSKKVIGSRGKFSFDTKRAAS